MGYLNNDIEKYLKGELTAAEMHALEQRALKDPFLAEALEGAEHAGPDNFSLDIHNLQRSIHDKTHRKRSKTITLNGWGLYLGIAAGLLLLAVSSFVVFTMIKQQQREKDLAENKVNQAPTSEPSKDSRPRADSISAIAGGDTESKPRESDRIQSNPSDKNPIASAEKPGTTNSQPAEEAEADQEPIGAIASEELAESQATSSAPVSRSVAGSEKPSAATRLVSGTVISPDEKDGVPGVNVMIKGTNLGTITNAAGKFEIDVPVQNSELIFSYIGLTTQEVALADQQSNVSVTMAPDPSQLSEVVISSNGERRKESVPLLEMAVPEGGRTAFKKYLEEQMQYPKQALSNKVEGGVTVQFTVQTNGQLSNFKILKGLGYGCDEEVIRLIKEGPAWSPGKEGNKTVEEKVTIRLLFDLPSKN